MTNNQIKILAIAFFLFLTVIVVGFQTGRTSAGKNSDQEIAALYKAKCAACHTPKAEKFLDLTLTDEQFAEIILKGKKGEKPPFMPEFQTKGITPEQAKALAVYMRKLRAPESANTNAERPNANVNVSLKANANANSNKAENVNANIFVNTNANVNLQVNANSNGNVNIAVNANANTSTGKISNEVATVYKTKCAACHSPKAEKLYDPAKPVEEQVGIILKGKKGKKPPYMPGFETKGMTAEQAKALAEYMKLLRASGK